MVRKSRKGREEWKIYKNVFDQFTERNLFELSTQGHFKALESPVALGKEANVFSARKTDGELVMVKIYRLENCNFKKMFDYIKVDPRYQSIRNQKRKIVFSWVQREYRNLLLARERIRVPTPLAIKDNIIVMELVGEDEPAPKLKDSYPKDPVSFLGKTVDYMKGLIFAGMVHGDLSEFNILNNNEEPVFIDFSQGTTIKAPNAEELLVRDVRNIFSFFKGTKGFDEDKTRAELVKLLNEESIKSKKDLKDARGY